MFKVLVILLFIGLLGSSIRLALRLTWGVAKIIAALLMVLALPVLILCLIFAGGLILLLPVAMVGIAAAVLKCCIKP